jgi:uncharacterized protein
MSSPIESRSYHLDVEPSRPPTEARDGAPSGRVVYGHAAVYSSLSDDLGGFEELIRPGAFTEALRGNPDVTALFNHDPNYLLGRTTSGTLKLADDSKGLAVKLTLSNASIARDVAIAMDRGDLCSMSFAFTVDVDVWRKLPSGAVIREIVKCGRLFDVSIVTSPAYPAATASIRGLEPARTIPPRSMEDFRRQLAAVPSIPPAAGWRTALLRRQLQLAEAQAA